MVLVNLRCGFLGQQNKDAENTAEKMEKDFSSAVKLEDKEPKQG